METLKQVIETHPPVIARMKDGGLLRGHLDNPKRLSQGVVQLAGLNGESMTIDVRGLKGIFFVRDFDGRREYVEDKTLQEEPERAGLRIQLRFEDNEILEGVTDNSLDLIAHQGFYFWPPDPKSNNRLIYVVKSALIGFRVLGMKAR